MSEQGRAIADMVHHRVQLANIPHELRARNQWVMWRYATKRGQDKPTKIPFHPSGSPAKSNDPATWSAFGEVVDTGGYDGIGYEFDKDDPYIGIDLDDVIVDGKMLPWAQKFVDRVNTYTEISPSGNGVKMWVKGKYPVADETGKRVGFKNSVVEMYHFGRYFCMTGRVWPDTPPTIRENQAAVDGIYNTILNPKPQPTSKPKKPAIDRCMAYLEKMPDAISGSGGHNRTYNVACVVWRFGLSDTDARRVMEWYSATKCSPPWTEKEITHKLEDTRKRVMLDGEFGKLADAIESPRIVLPTPPVESDGLKQVLRDTISGKIFNVPWPWHTLTTSARALIPGTVTVLCGAAGSTKSLLISQATLYWLERQYSFAVFHLEEDREFHQLRYLAQLEHNSMLTNDRWIRDHPDETMEAYCKHAATLDAIGERVWDAPTSDITITDAECWIRDRAVEGARVIVVDPITAADSGDKPWSADRKFVVNAKRIMRDHGASLIVITHPRTTQSKGATSMDNHAGGQGYNRFSSVMLDLRAGANEEVMTLYESDMGNIKKPATVNRWLHMHKTRSAGGRGWDIGFYFDPKTLRFNEEGLVLKE